MPTQRPPDIPPGLPPNVADYLRRLNAWAYQEIDKKASMNEAIPSLLFAASDQKNPNAVWRLSVNADGSVVSTSIPLGSGSP